LASRPLTHLVASAGAGEPLLGMTDRVASVMPAFPAPATIRLVMHPDVAEPAGHNCPAPGCRWLVAEVQPRTARSTDESGPHESRHDHLHRRSDAPPRWL